MLAQAAHTGVGIGMIRTRQRLVDQMAQTCYIWDIAIADLVPEVVNKTLRQSIVNVCSLDSDRGLLISCMIRGISVIRLEMSLQRLDLVLFYLLSINTLVTANKVIPNNPGG